MALTDRQQRFVLEYLLDLNATQAAKRAGYSARRARQEGSRLLGRPDVQAAILDAKRARAERAELDADWVLKNLVAEALDRGEGSTHGGRVRALELLGKHLGIFEDRCRVVTGSEPSPFEERLKLFRQRYAKGSAEASAGADQAPSTSSTLDRERLGDR